jgi:hypothetical protein
VCLSGNVDLIWPGWVHRVGWGLRRWWQKAPKAGFHRVADCGLPFPVGSGTRCSSCWVSRAVKWSSRTRTTATGVWIRTRAPTSARVSLVIRPSRVIRPGLGFATAVSFGLPAPAAPLTLTAGRGICRV